MTDTTDTTNGRRSIWLRGLRLHRHQHHAAPRVVTPVAALDVTCVGLRLPPPQPGRPRLFLVR